MTIAVVLNYSERILAFELVDTRKANMVKMGFIGCLISNGSWLSLLVLASFLFFLALIPVYLRKELINVYFKY